MQIDMHFAGTYIVARAAGFADADAQLIANASQYVDDSVTSGFIRFDNGALFQRTATAHRMLDGDNLNELDNHLAWLPFHFLPGNEGETHADRLICRPNSRVAQDMAAACIAARARPHSLHRLGITAHVFVDTYAHQGFAGMIHDVNYAKDLKSDDEELDESALTEAENFLGKLRGLFTKSAVPMLGHGLASSYPDLPWLSWSYTDGQSKTIRRNNLDIFMEALDELCKIFQRYRDAEASGLPAATGGQLRRYLAEFTDVDPEKRLPRWLDLLKRNAFGFGAVTLAYKAQDWREAALGHSHHFGGAALDEIEEIPFPDGFMTSDWKLFHDAAKDHRHTVLQHILPGYGLCAA